MTRTPIGAHRTSALLRILLDQKGRPISTRRVQQMMADSCDLPEGDRSDEQAVRRAAEKLESWGHRIERQSGDSAGPTLRLVSPESGETSQRLQLTHEAERVRSAARTALLLLDGNQEVGLDVLAKAHVPRDRISFGYGPDGERFEGVPYLIDMTGRSRVLVATDSGDLGFHTDAIRDLRVVALGDDVDVRDHDAEPPLVESDAVVRPWFSRSRGRPSDFVKLREVQALVAAIHAAVAPGSESTVSVRDLARSTGMGVASIRALSCVVECADEAIVFGEHDARVKMPGENARSPLDGPQALVTRLDMAALLSLGDAASTIDGELTVPKMEQLVADLDQFLDRICLDEHDEVHPCAVAVVDAAIAHAEGLGFEIAALVSDGNSTGIAGLRVEGLVWSGQQWWVRGAVDGKRISERGLPLSAILQIDPETRFDLA